ncbi:MAG: M18 family aminopeptidase [Sphaerochaetaceae bacterium]|nr:M18 family aminopeptidase [Sphaerochaetaceae bacterium]
MQDALTLAQDLIDFIHVSPSPFHVVRSSVGILQTAGFVELDQSARWDLERGGRYFVTVNGSALIAFTVGTGKVETDGFRLIQTHTDSPSIRIKPNPEMTGAGGIVKLNAEVYGSPILPTWLDRPLSLAGRVSLAGTSPLAPQQVLVEFADPQVYIPNLSIHHNKSVNSGVELNPQKDMIPILGQTDGSHPLKLVDLLARQIGCKPEEILDYELYTSEFERGCVFGPDREFISSKKLDNLGLLYASVCALAHASKTKGTQIICCLDSEEVGNRTRQGGDSPMLSSVLERIVLALGGDREDYFRTLQRSFMLSADMSHAVHPNVPERSDPVVQAKLNGGVVIKSSGAQKFTTNSESSAVFQQICKEAKVPWQYYVNRADSPGGSAAGADSITHADMRGVDIGLALWAMHSIRETGGTRDNAYVYAAFTQFFHTEN